MESKEQDSHSSSSPFNPPSLQKKHLLWTEVVTVGGEAAPWAQPRSDKCEKWEPWPSGA